MPALVAAFGMARTRGRGHQHNRAELSATILAGVFTLFATLIKLVLAFVTSVRVLAASGGN